MERSGSVGRAFQLDPNDLTLMVFLKEFFKKLILKKSPFPTDPDDRKHAKLSSALLFDFEVTFTS